MNQINYLNNPTKTQLKLALSNNLNILYMNILSLPPKLEEVEFLLKSLGITAHIILLTETWIAEHDINNKKKKFELKNYQSFHHCRKNQRGGGIACYVSNNIRCRVAEVYNSQNVQFMVVDLMDLNTKIGICYRPPNRTNIPAFEQGLQNLLSKHRRLILLGDINIDLLNENDSLTKNYANTLASLHFTILNKVDTEMATRIDPRRKSSKVIDHVVSDLSPNLFGSCVVKDNVLSDHRMLLLDIKINHKINDTESNTITKINYENVSKDLSSLPTISFSLFHSHLMQPIDKNTHKVILKTNKSINKPWFDDELRRLNNLRDKFFKLKTKYPLSIILLEKFKFHRRNFRRIIKQKKKSYYSKLYDNNKGNSRITWAITNEIITNKCKSNSEHISLVCDNKIITDETEVSSNFNSYFAEVGSSVIPNFKPSNNIQQSVPVNTQFESFQPITENELTSVITNLKNCSAGYDRVKSSFLKLNLNFFVAILINFINEIFLTNNYPDFLKVARIKPLHKDGPKTEISNYRPVSITTVFSKIIETIMSAQLTKFLFDNRLLNSMQFGFLKTSSTTNAAITLIDSIIQNTEKKLTTACIFVDLSKAFDCMNYEQLRLILERNGIIGGAVKLIMSYLTNRKQFVELNGVRSDLGNVESGLPQGSCMTILFLIYINTLFHLKLHGKLIMYADDSALVYGASDTEALKLQMAHDLVEIRNFLARINMRINFKKTSFILFKQKKHLLFDDIQIDNELIKRVDDYEYLGLTIDSNLSFNKHATKVLNKVSRFAGIVYRIRNFTSRKTLLSLYFANVQSHMSYMVPVWGNCSLSMTDKIQIAQNKILKMIYRKPRRFNTIQLYKDLGDHNILMFKHLTELETSSLIYKIKNKMIHIDITIPTGTQTFQHKTRSSSQLRRPSYKTTSGRNSVFYKGVVLFNNLPDNIRNATTLQDFKCKLRKKYKDSLK